MDIQNTSVTTEEPVVSSESIVESSGEANIKKEEEISVEAPALESSSQGVSPDETQEQA